MQTKNEFPRFHVFKRTALDVKVLREDNIGDMRDTDILI